MGGKGGSGGTTGRRNRDSNSGGGGAPSAETQKLMDEMKALAQGRPVAAVVPVAPVAAPKAGPAGVPLAGRKMEQAIKAEVRAMLTAGGEHNGVFAAEGKGRGIVYTNDLELRLSAKYGGRFKLKEFHAGLHSLTRKSLGRGGVRASPRNTLVGFKGDHETLMARKFGGPRRGTGSQEETLAFVDRSSRRK